MKKLPPEELAANQKRQIAVANAARSAIKVQWAKDKRHRHRLELFERYGGRCSCCGCSDWRWLTIHHKNGDGKYDRPSKHINAAARITLLWKQPKRDDLELLCYNCHMSMEYFGCCPHNDPDSPCYIKR